MRVVLLIDHLGAGGAQRQMAGLACLLKEKGVDVKLLTYFPHDFYEHQLEASGVVNETVLGAASSIKRLPSLRKRIKTLRPDVVIAYLDTPCILACLIRRLGVKYKLIVSERNTTQVLTKHERLKFALYRAADMIVPNSFSQGEFIATHYPAYVDKTHVIPNFVDLDTFRYEGVRQRKDRRMVMVAASIWASKNTKGLIEAVRLLKERRTDFLVKWYGLTGNTTIEQNRLYQEDCFRFIREYGLEEHIQLLEKTKDIRNAYHEADYFCLPSFYEGTPNALCEAMASSLPVACSSVCDNPVYVKDSCNGVLFNPKDPADIADALDRMLGIDDTVYSAWAANSRMVAEKYFKREVFVDSYLQKINQILN